MSHIDEVLTYQDLRFSTALQGARTWYHSATYGAEFEREVLEIIRGFLPARYLAEPRLLGGDVHKQLDFVVHSDSVPRLFPEVPISWIAVAAEVKTVLRDRANILQTAEKLAQAAADSGRSEPVPFLVLAGETENVDLRSLVAEAAGKGLWPAVFSFDRDKPVSVVGVGETSPIRLARADGKYVEGVAEIGGEVMSPSALCYLWLWSAIYTTDPLHGMDFRYMRDVVEDLRPIEVTLREAGGKPVTEGVLLKLPDDWAAPQPPLVTATAPRNTSVSSPVPTARPGGPLKVMLITLGPWVDQFDTWDESAWGGGATETHRGYGYYEGMPDDELLAACRVFWKFNPDSNTWKDVEYAVVAYAGVTRAVVHIDKFIGPFWGRYGFQGRVVKDLDRLVGREVPHRRNPITTIELSSG